MKYIVTGGAGFIGSHMVEHLLYAKEEVIVVDDLSTGFLENLPEHKNLTFVKVDISNWDDLSKHFAYFKNAEGIFHFAARARIQPSIYNPLETIHNNIIGTSNVLEIMRMMDIKKIVYSASSSSYGLKVKIPCKEKQEPDCLNPYAATKYAGEILCKTWGKLYDIKNVCLKYFNVYGERSPLNSSYAPVIGLFFQQALQGNPVTIVGSGNQRRDYTAVRDIVNANKLAMEYIENATVNGETFNIGTGVNYSINELVNMIISVLNSYGIKVKKEHIPPRPAEAKETLADINKAKKYLKWEPTTVLPEELNRLAGYYKHTIR